MMSLLVFLIFIAFKIAESVFYFLVAIMQPATAYEMQHLPAQIRRDMSGCRRSWW